METIRERIYDKRGSFNYSNFAFLREAGFAPEYRKKVFSIILNTKKTQGDEAAEEIATRLIEIVDSCETEEELLDKLHQLKKEM